MQILLKYSGYNIWIDARSKVKPAKTTGTALGQLQFIAYFVYKCVRAFFMCGLGVSF